VRAIGCLSLSLVVLCGGPAVAAAAPSPRDGVVVAGDGSAKLTVRDDGRALCVGLAGLGRASDSCGDVEGEGAFTIASPNGSPGVTPRRFLGAAVPAAATRLEVRRAGKLLASGPTVAGEAYRGRRAGRVRFALLRLPAGVGEAGLRVRAIDAAGAPVKVFAPGESDLVTDRRVLLAGRSGRTRWSVISQRRSSLSSALFDLDHETVQRCLTVDVTGSQDSNTSEGECAGGTPQDNAFGSLFAAFGPGRGAALEDVCKARFRLLHGVVAGRRVRVSVVLGDGRRLRARSAPFPEAGGTAYAIVVPPGAAVRSVRAQPANAAPRDLRFSAPPLTVTCASGYPAFDGGQGFDPSSGPATLLTNLPTVTPAGPVTTIAGVPGFRIADGPGDSLCLAVADRPFTALSCGIVAPGYSEGSGAVDDFSRPRAFVVAVPAQVARIRFGPKAGPARELPTVAADGYAGRYAGRARYLAATITGVREFQRMVLLDDAGKVLHTETDNTSEADLAGPTVSTPRRVAGARGRPSLWQTSFRTGGSTLRCLALTRGGPPRAHRRCRAVRSGSVTAIVSASCATHRLTAAVAAARGARVFVRDGRGVRRAVPLRAGAAVLTLPAGTGLASLTVERRGRRTARVPVHAPAATEQCGWDTVLGPTGSGGGSADVVARPVPR